MLNTPWHWQMMGIPTLLSHQNHWVQEGTISALKWLFICLFGIFVVLQTYHKNSNNCGMYVLMDYMQHPSGAAQQNTPGKQLQYNKKNIKRSYVNARKCIKVIYGFI